MSSDDKSGGCPFSKGSLNKETTETWGTYLKTWIPNFKSSEGSVSLENSNRLNESKTCCPEEKDYNPLIGDIRVENRRSYGQCKALSQERQHSTIPKGEKTPHHQPEGKNVWIYPSEQQYYNAMKKKGWKPIEDDIPIVLGIHNAVNEQGWSMVKEWESFRGRVPVLAEFRGRPNDMSPKAWIMTNILGYKPPFDRHDWIVESNGERTRYILDFYAGKGTKEKPVGLFIDVRPALDNADACIQRFNMFMKLKFGVTLFGNQRVLEDQPRSPDDNPNVVHTR